MQAVKTFSSHLVEPPDYIANDISQSYLLHAKSIHITAAAPPISN